jgi:hypothetical protein
VRRANEVSQRLRSMESGAIAGRGADFSDLQGIRWRARVCSWPLAVMGFVTACSMETTRRRAGEPNRHSLWLPALPIMDPAFVAGFNLLGADAEARLYSRRGAAAAATHRRERRNQQAEATAAAAAPAAGAAGAGAMAAAAAAQ